MDTQLPAAKWATPVQVCRGAVVGEMRGFQPEAV